MVKSRQLSRVARYFSAQAGKLPQQLGIPGVEHTIAIASGKGGVGKSTAAVNLAVALGQQGRSVGLLDADVHGPSVPRMMNLRGQPTLNADERLIPLENYGVKCMSMGFLMQDKEAAMWRGPMVMSAIQTFVKRTDWGQLDIIVIDMPPGTGDAQISIGQLLALSGAVIISTPQDIALADAVRGAALFRKINVPVLGLLENMSYHVCASCGARSHIFGEDGGKRLAHAQHMELLGQIPLHVDVRTCSDEGSPIVARDVQAPAAQAYKQAAHRVWELVQIAKPQAPTIRTQ